MKRALCSRKAIAVPWKCMPSGAAHDRAGQHAVQDARAEARARSRTSSSTWCGLKSPMQPGAEHEVRLGDRSACSRTSRRCATLVVASAAAAVRASWRRFMSASPRSGSRRPRRPRADAAIAASTSRGGRRARRARCGRLPSATNDGRLKSLTRGNRATFSFISGRSWLSPASYTTIARSTGVLARAGRIARREHPVEHRPRHLREAGKEMMVADRERGDAIDRIRNDRRLPAGNSAISTRCGYAAAPNCASSSRDRLGMAHERHAERRRRGLPRVIVGRRADAAEAEHEVAARERCRAGTPSAGRDRRRRSARSRARARARRASRSRAARCGPARLPGRISSPMMSAPIAMRGGIADAQTRHVARAVRELVFDLRHHAAERAIDQRLGLDQARRDRCGSARRAPRRSSTAPSVPGGW